MCSPRDLILYSIWNILPQNTLLPIWKPVISSVLIISSALQFFSLLFLFWIIFRGRLLYRFSALDSAWTIDLQNTSSLRNSLETLLGFDYSTAYRTHRSARKSCKVYRCHSWPLTLSSIHNHLWETHLVCEKQVALNDATFAVIEISLLFHKYQTTSWCLACTTMSHVYVGCKLILSITPQNMTVVESHSAIKWTKKTPLFRLIVQYRIWVLTWALASL